MRENNQQWAVWLGRFQPFHLGHYSVLEAIRKRFDSIVIHVGEQQKGDLLSFHHRANGLKKVLDEMGFKFYAIIPMKDNEDWDKWGDGVVRSTLDAVDQPSLSSCCLVVTKKACDVKEDGTHYLDYLLRDGWFEERNQVSLVPIPYGDKGLINGRDLRASHTLGNLRRVHPIFQPSYKHRVGLPLIFHMPVLQTTGEKWVNLKRIKLNGAHFEFSQRRNKDSVAFLIYNVVTGLYGAIIEEKPPLLIGREISAFGGGFNQVGDNPVRIVRQEANEEAAIAHGFPHYVGSFMATTQSDEIVHLFCLHTTEVNMSSRNGNETEVLNTPIWMSEEEIENVGDWRVKLIVNDNKERLRRNDSNGTAQ